MGYLASTSVSTRLQNPIMFRVNHSTRFLLLNTENVPMTTHHLRILSKPEGVAPGKALYVATTGLVQSLDIRFQYTEDGSIAARTVGSDETFNFVPIMEQEKLVGIQLEYPDGTTVTFAKELPEYNFEIQNAVFEKRLERVQ